ncbi:integrase [Rhizobium sp. BK661]|uniref:integrase n=1 Tax=Rhizobium sp. BK661 TaxID=2586991 RepID=UPI002169E052|nr:integrase [Rhizobium sp. BK661]MCS3740238.1 integrase [Rhizobium sp. BK661]
MAGKLHGFLNRDGRYFSRLVIPKELRPYLENKTELREPLGPDLRAAKAKHFGAMAQIQARIAEARRHHENATGKPTSVPYPLSAEEIAARHYQSLVAFDSELRDTHPAYANADIDDVRVAVLRDGIAGKLTDTELQEVVGSAAERFRYRGNTNAMVGSTEWRVIARALCVAELEFTARKVERDEGDFTGSPENPMLTKALAKEPENINKAEFNEIKFEDIIQEQIRVTDMGLGKNRLSPATLKKYRAAAWDFEQSRRGKKVATITLAEGEAWRDKMLTSGELTRKTILDKLAAIRAIMAWGQKQSKGTLFPNGMPFEHLDLPVQEVRDSSDRTYSLEQARKVLIAARAETRPSYRWSSWLVAYSGMRINEALQLCKEDFFAVEGRWFYHIRVGEGRTTKTRKSRKVPLHNALIDEGFLTFLHAAPTGKLFPGGSAHDNRIREWIHEGPLKGDPNPPAPNHGFRHLFEDALNGDVGHRAALYITGRSTGSSADDYGGSDIKLLELAAQMDKVRRFL